MSKINKFCKTLIASLVSVIIIYTFIAPGFIEQESMLPLYKPGECYIVSKLFYKMTGPKRGDVIALHDYSKDILLVKRVIAIEGDSLRITTDGKVYLNEVLINEPYIYEQAWTTPIPIDIILPKDTVFVMGDNRRISYDSRTELGVVGKTQIIGKLVWKIPIKFNKP